MNQSAWWKEYVLVDAGRTNSAVYHEKGAKNKEAFA